MNNKLKIIKHNIWQIIICLDQFICCLGGMFISIFSILFKNVEAKKIWADETLSSKAWRWNIKGIKWPSKIIDFIFFFNKENNKKHCELSYDNELNRLQLPPEMRQ